MTTERNLIPIAWRDRSGRWSTDSHDKIDATEFIDEYGRYCLTTKEPSPEPDDPEPCIVTWPLADVTRNDDDHVLVYWWDATDG